MGRPDGLNVEDGASAETGFEGGRRAIYVSVRGRVSSMPTARGAPHALVLVGHHFPFILISRCLSLGKQIDRIRTRGQWPCELRAIAGV